MTLTYAEFCAGAGGLGRAVEQVFGAELRWYSEFEAAPSAVMAHHWPGIPNHGDMTTIDFTAVERVDILSGGTPCQDLSHAGRRAGMRKGSRSGLWESMREAIAIIQPRYVVWENVRGAYSAGADSEADSEVEPLTGRVGAGDGQPSLRALGRVLGDLASLGFDAQWRGIRASDVGAPHGRFRVFVLAERQSATTHAGGLRGNQAIEHHGRGPEAHHGAGVPDQPDREPVRTGSIGASAAADADNLRGDGRWSRTIQDRRGQPTDGRDTPADAFGSGRQRWGEDELAGASEHASRNSQGMLHAGHHSTDWGPYAPAIRRWQAVLGRAAPAPTELTTKGKHRLSADFACWMMGWPAGWVDLPGTSRNEQLKIIGNGVVTIQAAAALDHMLSTQEAAA